MKHRLVELLLIAYPGYVLLDAGGWYCINLVLLSVLPFMGRYLWTPVLSFIRRF